LDAGFGRKVRGLKVTSTELGGYVERVVRRYAQLRTNGERFAQWVARAEEADLR
jgi:sulfite reductase (ferredoxin)